jgi:hypothetical protein
VVAALIHADRWTNGRTVLTKLIGALLDCANAPNSIRTQELKIRKEKYEGTQREDYGFYPSVEVLNQGSRFGM